MSGAIKVPNARQDVEAAYQKMMDAYDFYRRIGGENYERYYQAQLNNYRDLCTVIVGRLIRENPKVLEDMHVLYLL